MWAVFGFIILCWLFWIGLKVTGAVLKAFFWMFIWLPIVMLLFVCGTALCCTILLIPLGIGLIRMCGRMLRPNF